MTFKVEEPLADIYPEKAIRKLTIATTMANRYRSAVSEGVDGNTLLLSRLTRARAQERDSSCAASG